jgi:hypothetical protein
MLATWWRKAMMTVELLLPGTSTKDFMVKHPETLSFEFCQNQKGGRFWHEKMVLDKGWLVSPQEQYLSPDTDFDALTESDRLSRNPTQIETDNV